MTRNPEAPSCTGSPGLFIEQDISEPRPSTGETQEIHK